MGYSMGGRISLELLQRIPHRVRNLVLLAPDGLHVNPWYWFATQTRVGNRFFRKVMLNPDRFVALMRKAGSMNLLNKGVIKFVDRYLEDSFVREQVYRVWTSFRKFRPHLDTILEQISEHNIPVSMIYGKYDTIIPLAPGEKFFQRLTGKKRFDLLESGHQVLHVRNAPYIAEAFNHRN
jgi:pimeloyl-ACP methyl ester carboxylesterase